MDRTELRHLFAWRRCHNCMTVTEDQEIAESAPDQCPSCGQTGYFLDWPPEPARLLLRSAFRQSIEDYEGLATMSFLVASSMDSIVQWVVGAAAEYLAPEGQRGAQLIESAHDPALSTEERLHLLKNIADLDYKGVAESLDEPGFASRWKDLRNGRDQFVQFCDPSAFQSVTEQDLFDLARMAVKVFARLNNMIW